MNLVDACLFCEGAATFLCKPGKHTVTHAEPLDVAANSNDFAREFVAQHERKLWPIYCAKLPLSELEINRVQSGSAYADENIAWPWRRCCNLRQLRPFSAAVVGE